ALVSMLDAKGRPMPTERVWMLAPGSRIGPATDAERQAVRAASMLGGKYEQIVDRESAYEILRKRAASLPADVAVSAGTGEPANAPGADGGLMGTVNDFLFGSTGPRGGRRDGIVQSAFKSAARSAANRLVRGVLGSLIGRK